VGLTLVVMLTAVVAQGLALSAPRLQRTRTIRTTPFANRNVSMRDNEGSAYVPRNKSLWLADDNGRAVFEVNPSTGGLKRSIGRKRFESAVRYGGGPMAGVDRTRDFESMAYDRAHDTLYVFSSTCCGQSVLPAAFRLKRGARGVFRVASYQPLPSTTKITAAAWNAANGKLYVGFGSGLRTYDYARNSLGRAFRVPNLTDITGMGFSPDGRYLYVTTGAEQLRRVRWATKRLVGGWTFGLTGFGIHDSRAVEVIDGRFYVVDGDDARSKADPLRYAVYVLRPR
jgi:sugar lactone lactonase YvrE